MLYATYRTWKVEGAGNCIRVAPDRRPGRRFAVGFLLFFLVFAGVGFHFTRSTRLAVTCLAIGFVGSLMGSIVTRLEHRSGIYLEVDVSSSIMTLPRLNSRIELAAVQAWQIKRFIEKVGGEWSEKLELAAIVDRSDEPEETNRYVILGSQPDLYIRDLIDLLRERTGIQEVVDESS